jgi:GTPase-associated system helical domain
MMSGTFDFMTAYRKLASQTPREVVDARQKAYSQLTAQVNSMPRIYDLCRLAFQLDLQGPEVATWFEQPIKESDPQFSIEIDKAEAGRLASLLLREHIASVAGPYSALAVVTASFCGKRSTVDDNIVLVEAKDALTRDAKRQRELATAIVQAPQVAFSPAALKALEPNPPTPESIKGTLDHLVKSACDALAALAKQANEAIAASRGDTQRLAEEVDMLWWHLGDWSDLVGKSRSKVKGVALPLVSGIELGSLVQRIPGPYGAYGLLSQSASAAGNTTLTAAISSLGKDDVAKLASSKPLPAWTRPLFPIHAALSDGMDDLKSVSDIELDALDIALQAYRERMLINYGGIGQ